MGRTWVAAAGLVLVAAGLALMLLVPRGASHTVSLSGSAITGAPLAPDFRLTDQQGHAVSLAGLRGDVVLVTFLYVHCPDVCPLIASRLNSTLPLLGGRARVLAVSVDPKGDTPQAVRRYVRQRALAPRFRYLIGTRPELERVWTRYYVGAQRAPNQVLHTAMTVLVDREGRERVRYDASATPAQIAHDVHVLKL